LHGEASGYHGSQQQLARCASVFLRVVMLKFDAEVL